MDKLKVIFSGRKQKLNALNATIIFIGYLCVELFSGAIFIIVSFFVFKCDFGIEEIASDVKTFSILFGHIIGFFSLVIFSRNFIDSSLDNKSPISAIWDNVTPFNIGVGLLAGTTIALFAFNVLLKVQLSDNSTNGTIAFSKMLISQDVFQLTSFLFIAITFTPFVEELLFRGIIYGGFKESFGSFWSVCFASVLFLLMHYFDRSLSTFSFLTVLILTFATFLIRIQTKSIGPAIAIHFSHNLTIIVIVSWLKFKI